MSNKRHCDFYQRSPILGKEADPLNLVDILIFFTLNGLMPNRLITESPELPLNQDVNRTTIPKIVLAIEPERCCKSLLSYLEFPNGRSIPRSSFFIFAEWCDLGDTAIDVYRRIRALQSQGLTPIAFRQRCIDLKAKTASLLATLEMEMLERQHIKVECDRRGIKMVGKTFVFADWFPDFDRSFVYHHKEYLKRQDAVAKRFEELHKYVSPLTDMDSTKGKELSSKLTSEADMATYERRNQPCNFCTIYMGDYAITAKDQFTFLFQTIADFIIKKDMVLTAVYCDYDLTSKSRHRNLGHCIADLDHKKGKSTGKLDNHKSFFLFPSWPTIAKNENDAFSLIQLLRQKDIMPIAVMQEHFAINIYDTRKSILNVLKKCYTTNPEKHMLWDKVIGLVPPDALPAFPLPKQNMLTEKIRLMIYRTTDAF